LIEKKPSSAQLLLVLFFFWFLFFIARALAKEKAAVRVVDGGGVGLFLSNLGGFWIYKGDVGLGGNESSFSEIGNW